MLALSWQRVNTFFFGIPFGALATSPENNGGERWRRKRKVNHHIPNGGKKTVTFLLYQVSVVGHGTSKELRWGGGSGVLFEGRP